MGPHYVAIKEDITDRKRAEEELRESQARAEGAEKRLVDAIESLPVGFALYDCEDRLVLQNSKSSAMFSICEDLVSPGVRFEDILRLAVERGQFPHAAGREEEWIAQRLRVRRELAGPIEQLDRDGRWLLINHRRTSDGGTVTIRTDITEMKRREGELLSAKECLERQGRELEQLTEELVVARDQAVLASRAKSEFLANMSHELRTPLNAIIGFSEMIETGIFGPVDNPKYLEYARDIHASGEHLLDVISDILDLSKIEAGRMELQEQQVDVAELIGSCLTLVKDRGRDAGLVLEPEVRDGLPALCADTRKVKQIVLNLLSNAVKFTPSGGRITVRAAVDADGGLAIAVCDTGIGMAPEDFDKAMTSFGQVDGSLSRKFEGTGLGLPLSKALAELHDGTLELESEVGVGTIATVRFPPERVRECTGSSVEIDGARASMRQNI